MNRFVYSAAFAVLAIIGEVRAEPVLFSINVQSNAADQLVRVDAATGEVAVIGFLDTDTELDFPSLAVAHGRLFLVDSRAAADPVELLEVDPMTGRLLSSVEISHAGISVPLVEGFDSHMDELVISYGLAAGGDSGTRSNLIGTLRLDGTINDSVSLSATDDLDGIAIDGQGSIFGVDASSPHTGSDVLSVQLDPPTTTLLTTIGLEDTDIVDLAFTDTGQLFGLDVVGNSERRIIHHIDTSTGEPFASITVDPSWSLRGLAAVDAIVIPEPSSWGLIAVTALCGLIRARRFRRALTIKMP